MVTREDLNSILPGRNSFMLLGDLNVRHYLRNEGFDNQKAQIVFERIQDNNLVLIKQLWKVTYQSPSSGTTSILDHLISLTFLKGGL